MTPLRKLVRSIADNVNTWIGRKTAQVTDLAPMETASLQQRPSNSSLRVKVKRCRDVFWYQHYIGETFVVVYQDSDRWWVREPDEFGFLNFIFKDDTEIV
jgi:hypothetical protein